MRTQKRKQLYIKMNKDGEGDEVRQIREKLKWPEKDPGQRGEMHLVESGLMITLIGLGLPSF